MSERNKTYATSSIFSGLLWTYAERLVTQGVSLIVAIILARILDPEHYGTIALVTVFISIADTFVTAGFGNALIQKFGADELDFSTVFFFSMVMSCILYAMLFFVAPAIAAYYEMAALTPVIRVMALRLPIAALNSVQHAYISKNMAFKKFFFSSLGGTLTSAATGIAMAYYGFGIWALVAQNMTDSIIDSIVLWFTAGWRPKWLYSHKRMRTLFSFGWKLLLTSLLFTLYSELRSLIIAKKYSSIDLAYYDKGYSFPRLISNNIDSSITKVLFPALSNCQNDITRVKALTRQSIRIGMLIMTPLLFGLAAIAEPFVRLLLTEKWLPCVPYLQIMCILWALQPVQTCSVQAINALGRSDVYMKLEIIKKAFGLFLLGVAVLCFHNTYAIALSALAAQVFAALLNLPFNSKLFGYKISEQLKDTLIPIILAFLMWIAVYCVGLIGLGDIASILLQVFAGGIVYLALSWFFNRPALIFVREILTKLFKSRNAQ